ncbi:MAG: winged helix-turn-helix domain-containing protein [Kofleriaceae bacterium]
MSTLAVVEEILRETAVPMSVREIVERAGVRLPSKSKTPDTVVARDLSMDIKRKGESSLFARTSPGRYTLRVLAAMPVSGTHDNDASDASDANELPARVAALGTIGARKPAVAASPASAPRARTDSDVQGGGFAS